MKFLVDEMPNFLTGDGCPFNKQFIDREEGCIIDLCPSSKTEDCPMHHRNMGKEFTECCFLRKM